MLIVTVLCTCSSLAGKVKCLFILCLLVGASLVAWRVQRSRGAAAARGQAGGLFVDLTTSLLGCAVPVAASAPSCCCC